MNQHLSEEMQNALAAAVGDRLLHRLQCLLGSVPEDSRPQARLFALEAAADSGWEEALPELLKEAGENALPECLARVARLGLVASVRRLLALGAPADGTPELPDSPLACAVGGGHVEVVRLLLAAGADPSYKACELDSPPLGYVDSWVDDVEIVRLLLEFGAEVNPEGDWRSPLGYAAAEWSELDEPCESVRLLLEAGADPNTRGGPDGETPLHSAARHGHLQVISLLLEYGAEVNAKDSNTCTPLWNALYHQKEPAARLLLAAGADTSWLQDRLSAILLTSAARSGELPTLRLLVELGASPEAETEGIGCGAALTSAVRQNQVHVVRYLLSLGADAFSTLTFQPNAWQETLRGGKVEMARLILAAVGSRAVEATSCQELFSLVQQGYAGVLRLLLEAGVAADAPGEAGRTLLMEAALQGRVDCMRLLLAHGAQVEAQDADGWTPLMHAVNNLREAAAELLLSCGAELAPVLALPRTAQAWELMQEEVEQQGRQLAVREADKRSCDMIRFPEVAVRAVELARQLYPKEDEVRCGPRSMTALMHAAGKGHHAVVKQLLAEGAWVDSDVLQGRTALCEAARNGYPNVVQLLLEHGAAVNAGIRPHADTPLMLASAGGHADVVKALLCAGARVEVPFRLYGGPLAQAARGGHVEVMRLLLAAGADTEARGRLAETVLGDAAAAGQAGAVRLLLDHGANIEARRKDGKTPLHQAAAWGNAETVQLLLEAGANARALTPHGRDALWLAEAEHKQASAALLRAWLVAHPAEAEL